MVPGARALLEALSDRLDSWVVSATPQNELERIIEKRRLGHYFRGVHGAPPAKAETFATLLARHGLAPHEVLAIGDGLSDYRAAEAAGVHFVARSSDSSHQDWTSVPVPVVSSLAELFGPLGLDSDG
jgi:phosphoglycolate phosphatase-like HAD superfamily hydrolase